MVELGQFWHPFTSFTFSLFWAQQRAENAKYVVRTNSTLVGTCLTSCKALTMACQSLQDFQPIFTESLLKMTSLAFSQSRSFQFHLLSVLSFSLNLYIVKIPMSLISFPFLLFSTFNYFFFAIINSGNRVTAWVRKKHAFGHW